MKIEPKTWQAIVFDFDGTLAGLNIDFALMRAAVLRVFPDVELYADATLTRDDSQNVKPHPGHLQKALGILGVPEKDAAMVGDHPTDVMTARRAGSCAVGVLTGSADEKSLRAAGADLILANAFAILGHIWMAPS